MANNNLICSWKTIIGRYGACHVTLCIQINQKDTFAHLRQCGTKINSGSCLANPTLLVQKNDFFSAHASTIKNKSLNVIIKSI